MWSISFYQGFEEMGGSGEQTPQRTAQAVKGIEQLRDQKFFIWLYYWDPHAPYDPPEEFMQRYDPEYVRKPPPGKQRQNDENFLRDASGHFGGSIGTLKALNQGDIRLTSRDRRHLIALYDAEISYVDQGIAELVARLKELDLYDNTLIILNSDHGEGFGEHGMWYHGSTVYDEMSRVPLIIKPPRPYSGNKMVAGPVRNIDIVATILDYCGLDAPKDWNGQSLRPFIESDTAPDLPCITETQVGRLSHLMALRRRDHKLIYDVQQGKVWLYDMVADPEEKRSILPDSIRASIDSLEDTSPALELERNLRQDLLETLGAADLDALSPSREDLGPIDPQTRERLKALGYVY
jgi:arylsulfatase A-like enzyme